MLTPKCLKSFLRSSAINSLIVAFLCIWCSPYLLSRDAPSPLEPKQHSCRSRISEGPGATQVPRGVYMNCSSSSALLRYAPSPSFAPEDTSAFRGALDYNAGGTHGNSADGSAAYSKPELPGL